MNEKKKKLLGLLNRTDKLIFDVLIKEYVKNGGSYQFAIFSKTNGNCLLAHWIDDGINESYLEEMITAVECLVKE